MTATRPLLHARIAPRLLKALHAEAMAMAMASQDYFEGRGREDRERLDAAGRVAFACESLKVSTRLMQAVAWLLMHQAAQENPGQLLTGRRLQDAVESDARSLVLLPPDALPVIAASQELYERIRRLDAELASGAPMPSPARGLLDRLARSL